VVVSADGKRAAVARPGALTVVDAANGKLLLAVEPPEGILLVGTPGVALSADARSWLSVRAERTTRVRPWSWMWTGNEVLATVRTGPAGPFSGTVPRRQDTRHARTARTGSHGDSETTGHQAARASGGARGHGAAGQVWEVATGKEQFKAV